MSKHNHNAPEATKENPEVNEQETTGAESVEVMDNIEAEADETEALKDQLDKLQQELDKEKKEYLFLMAEFDNFRKRTLKEKSELIRNGAESAMKSLLPVVDDFERGIDAIKTSSDADAVKEGMILIYNKFVKYLEQNGVKAMDTDGQPYDSELHEAVAMVPGDEANKGLIIDTVQKGYMINDKVLRHAKVAVGQ